MAVLHFYSVPGISKGNQEIKLKELQTVSKNVIGLDTELCFNVETAENLTKTELERLCFLITSPFSTHQLQKSPFLTSSLKNILVEIGPRLNFSTPFSSNALSMCNAIGLKKITRLETTMRYLIQLDSVVSANIEEKIVGVLHDRMTECRYMEPIKSFDHGIVPAQWTVVDIMSKGRNALEDVNNSLGLAFDEWDLDYYTKLFKQTLKRNPTTVECFDLAQSNSEHSRHWFFKGKMFLNNIELEKSLIDMIIDTQNHSNPNNVIKFSDNSSAIQGFMIKKLRPSKVYEPSSFSEYVSVSHLIFTAETHNFPTGVAPFSGATTGTGGRIRDVQAVGRGGNCIGGTAGYSVGNLLIPGYEQPWEDCQFEYPDNLASPLKILIEASNGASDYGNKFGEPLICGFTRVFGQKDSTGTRFEYVKPIMFSGGVGSMESDMVDKFKPEKGMKIIKIGGPVYRIGVGGGSASSVQVQGDNQSELDFGAVQRGDAEMGNKLNRIIRSCIEHGTENPIRSIHDQGAGGNGNVLKELVEPEGAVIFTNAFTLGDNTVSTMELWGAEYQENDAALILPGDVDKLQKLSRRERCPVDIVGFVSGNGKVILTEDDISNETAYINETGDNSGSLYPFNLDLDHVLGKMPRKEFHLNEETIHLVEASFTSDLTVSNALDRVFKLTTVCSKRFLTTKVDRCVTGLIAQQQCVGPLHTPLADYAITAISMLSTEGVATAIGEQPIKGMINPAAGARMTVAESLSNLVFAKISCLKDVKCSGNWMWAAKLPGEGAKLYRACEAMCKFMSQLGIAIDGGKDSLSMAARVNKTTVKAPGTLVVSTYAPCPDITCKVTPDIKSPAMHKVGVLLWISLSNLRRLGGSALAQCFGQLGQNVPDVECPEKLKNAFNITQELISDKKILSGHDISDGGLITCILEMAFAGMSGLQIQIDTSRTSELETLFSEEVGWVLEVSPENVDSITALFNKHLINCVNIGQAVGYGMNSLVTIRNEKGNLLLNDSVGVLFKAWEETCYQLECKQANISCVTEEYLSLDKRSGPKFCLTFNPDEVPKPINISSKVPRVAVIREEGSNGDREMAISLYMAGFNVWDVTMQDLLDGSATTDMFRGIIFPGGFSYADTLGSAKGWAACLKFHPSLKAQFNAFVERQDTFSLGVCNGCQLMGLIGWIGCDDGNRESPGIILDHNKSERFECRFSTVKVEKCPAIMCKGMGGSTLGVWVAHGEGQFTFRDKKIKQMIDTNRCVSFRYVDDENCSTERYPMNPNGSVDGIAGICSKDGRHLAFMPHPERTTLMWQWPYVPHNFKHINASPWLRLFQNAYSWAMDNEFN